MLIQQPFRAITPTVDGDVLQILAGSHDEYTVPRLAALIPHRSPMGIRLAIDRLWEAGIVSAHRVGRTQVYRFNEAHVLAEPLRAIAGAKRSVLLRLRETVETWDHPPLFGAIFGSAARGDMDSDSDLDVFLACPDVREHDWGVTIGNFTDFATNLTGNDARVVELHGAELLAAEHRPLVDAVLREGIPFTSDSDWLRRAVPRTAAA